MQIRAAHARRLFWSAITYRSRLAGQAAGQSSVMVDEAPMPTDTASNVIAQDLSAVCNVEALAGEVEVSKTVWPGEGHRWHSPAFKVAYVELDIAHHDNL